MPYDLAADEPHARVLLGLDRAQHTVTMEGWYWNALDWLDAETSWKSEDCVRAAWTAAINAIRNRTTTNPGNFIADFTLALKYGIRLQIDEFERLAAAPHAMQSEPSDDNAAPSVAGTGGTGASGTDANQVRLVSWSPETREATLALPIESLGAIMAILGTVAATWSLQDEAAIGYGFDQVQALSDQLEAVLNEVPE